MIRHYRIDYAGNRMNYATNEDMVDTPFKFFVWEASELTAAFVLEEDYKLFLTQFRKPKEKEEVKKCAD